MKASSSESATSSSSFDASESCDPSDSPSLSVSESYRLLPRSARSLVGVDDFGPGPGPGPDSGSGFGLVFRPFRSSDTASGPVLRPSLDFSAVAGPELASDLPTLNPACPTVAMMGLGNDVVGTTGVACGTRTTGFCTIRFDVTRPLVSIVISNPDWGSAAGTGGAESSWTIEESAAVVVCSWSPA